MGVRPLNHSVMLSDKSNSMIGGERKSMVPLSDGETTPMSTPSRDIEKSGGCSHNHEEGAHSHDHKHDHGHKKHDHDHEIEQDHNHGKAKKHDDHHGHSHGLGGHSHAGHNHENMNIRAAIIHIIGDIVQSIGVVIASLIIFFYPEARIADPICTLLFTVLCIFTTIPIFIECMGVLMEATPR